MDNNLYDIIIIGSGPAGLTAGIYTARAALKVLIVGGAKWGGQLMQTTEVENFPGFPEGIMGPDLMSNMRKQAEKMGAVIIEDDVAEIETEKRPFNVKTATNSYSAKAIIVATGAAFNWLCLPNEQRLIGRGVSSCATCDAAFFRNKKVAVVGGGDAAMEEALVLSKFANEVILIHRRDSFRASKAMQAKVFNDSKIKIIWDTTVEDILGENKVEGIRLKTQKSNDKFTNQYQNSKIISQTNNEAVWEIPLDGVFVAIGHNPATELFKGKLELDEKGYLKRFTVFDTQNNQAPSSNNQTNFNNQIPKYHNMTSVEGVFVAGDVHDIAYKQAITAAGYGCQAALETERWLSENNS